MTEFFSTLSYYLEFPFVRYAFIVAALISLCASLLGVSLVLKRFSFIGDGLSHVAFGVIAIAAILNLSNQMLFVLPVTCICAVLLLKTNAHTKIRGDAAIAMLSVSALGVGYLILNIFGSSTNISGDVCTTLFGATSILTLSQTDVAICIILSIVVLLVFLLFYNKLFAVTFDEEFARSKGINTSFYNLIIAIISAVVIVIAMNLVGSLLVSALIIFPTLSAMSLFKTFKQVTICSGIFSVVSSVLGIVVSIFAETPVGATIVAIQLFIFICFKIISMILRRS